MTLPFTVALELGWISLFSPVPAVLRCLVHLLGSTLGAHCCSSPTHLFFYYIAAILLHILQQARGSQDRPSPPPFLPLQKSPYLRRSYLRNNILPPISGASKNPPSLVSSPPLLSPVISRFAITSSLYTFSPKFTWLPAGFNDSSCQSRSMIPYL